MGYLLRGFGGGAVGVGTAGAGQHVEPEIAAAFDPLVALLCEYRADEPDEGGAIGEDPDDVGSAPDLFVEPLLYPALGAGSTPGGGFESCGQ